MKASRSDAIEHNRRFLCVVATYTRTANLGDPNSLGIHAATGHVRFFLGALACRGLVSGATKIRSSCTH